MCNPSKKNGSFDQVNSKIIIRQSLLALFFSLVLPLILLGTSEYLNHAHTHQSTIDDNNNNNNNFPARSDTNKQQQQTVTDTFSAKHSGKSSITTQTDSGNKASRDYAIPNNDAAAYRRKEEKKVNSNTNNNVAQTSTMNSKQGELLNDYRQKNQKGRANSIISPQQVEAIEQVKLHEERTKMEPNNPLNWLLLAHAQLRRDGTSLTGGLASLECIDSFKKGIEILNSLEQSMIPEAEMKNLVQGKCLAYSNLAMAYNVADMYEDVLDVSSSFLKLTCQNTVVTDVLMLSGRACSVLGRYVEAGVSYLRILSKFDANKPLSIGGTTLPFAEIVTVLKGDENAIPGGWEWFSSEVTRFITVLDGLLDDNASNAPDSSSSMDANSQTRAIIETLQSAHRGMFEYYDKKTNDISQAWFHLEKANMYKQLYAPYDEDDSGLKKQIRERKEFFTPTLINQTASQCGSNTKRPIFIIGHPRSGTTLLETILNAHPAISGLGEASVLMNMMPQMQTGFPYAYKTAGLSALVAYTKSVADTVMEGMNERWESNLLKADQGAEVTTATKRLVDKQNINFHFVPYIHLIFPNALILHMVREPMDVLFSAYRLDLNNRDTEGNNHDVTSSFEGLANSYGKYRDVMNYWDEALPGRVMHVRYEDLVNDFEAVAKAVIKAADLDWDPSIIDFHKKERAINTPSANQVRQGLYTRSVQRWKKYEEFLNPLKILLGNNAIYDQETNLPGYKRK